VTGVNSIPALLFALVVFGFIFFGMYLIFASTDWLNDWVAQKSAKRGGEEVKSLRDVTSLLTAQTRAMAGLDKAQPQAQLPPTPRTLGEGGLMFDEATFDENTL
jgi:hypothetical protein